MCTIESPYFPGQVVRFEGAHCTLWSKKGMTNTQPSMQNYNSGKLLSHSIDTNHSLFYHLLCMHLFCKDSCVASVDGEVHDHRTSSVASGCYKINSSLIRITWVCRDRAMLEFVEREEL